MLDRLSYRVDEYDRAEQLLRRLREESPPAVIFYEVLPDSPRAFSALESFVRQVSPVPVVPISEAADVGVIVRAVQIGSAGYLVRPFRSLELERSIAAAMENGQATGSGGKKASRRGTVAFVCVSPKMRALEEMARRLAESDVTVLIRGESGVGKEVVARYIHRCSNRSKGPFVKVNCAALPEDLLESELFGYEKGAFTGAVTSKPGRFEAANHGTFLLDEISEMSPRLQAKLLHVLQDKSFSRLGGNREVEVDVRILAATNADLERAIEEHRFREDLYFRIKIIDLYVPPLRERREEIPLLIEHFLGRFSHEYGRPTPEPSEQLLTVLCAHSWPGNVRELENMIKRLVVLADESSVLKEVLSKAGRRSTAPLSRPGAGLAGVASESQIEMSLKKVGERAAMAAERTLILSTLEKTRWNRMQASRMLSVSYKTLLTKMKKCGLNEA